MPSAEWSAEPSSVSLDPLAALIAEVPTLNQQAMAAARARHVELTKPPGSLGRLERLAAHIAAITGQARPRLDRKAVIVMAGDHGVTAEGVSAYPAAVTAQVLRNVRRGTANSGGSGDAPAGCAGEATWRHKGSIIERALRLSGGPARG
jgi:nicotinate-nucleotide--dimethylbenzimidazole phosphoribosyltransferase